MIKKIRRFKIDLRRTCEYVDGEYEKIICDSLLQRRLFHDNFLYSFFNLSDLKRVMSTGSTRDITNNTIYAFNRTQLFIPGRRHNCTVRERLKEDLCPALAIYDGKQLKSAYITESHYGYEFRSPENRKAALLGIAEILMPN